MGGRAPGLLPGRHGAPAFQEQVRQVTALITAEDDPLDETAEAMKACAVEKIEQFRTDAGSEDDI